LLLCDKSPFTQHIPKVTSHLRFLLISLLSQATLLCAQTTPWKWQDAIIPDVGFDLDQAQVIRITSLATKGKGTLRDSLKIPGPKLIVFEVGGVINLELKSIEIHDPQVFIAGQTAPAPGITLIRGGLSIEANQCVVQHLKVRPGDAGRPKGSGWDPDSITTSGGPVDVWIDHCSATWGLDENISACTYKSPTGQPASRIYIRHCLIAEGLHESTHAKGPHSKGTLVLDGTKEVAIVGNLYASNVERNPVFKPDTSGVVVNNVIASPGDRAIHASKPDDASLNQPPAKMSVVGNLVFFGETTKRSANSIFEGTADAYFKDNEGYDWFGKPLQLLRADFKPLEKPPVWPEGLEPLSTAAALWKVTRFVGARPAERDPIDQRIISNALSGKARIINSQSEVGGYPEPAPTTRALEVPATNRKAWLEKLAKEVTYGSE
jgi:hypothetical protein